MARASAGGRCKPEEGGSCGTRLLAAETDHAMESNPIAPVGAKVFVSLRSLRVTATVPRGSSLGGAVSVVLGEDPERVC